VQVRLGMPKDWNTSLLNPTMMLPLTLQRCYSINI
jgi:hypothetical protein